MGYGRLYGQRETDNVYLRLVANVTLEVVGVVHFQMVVETGSCRKSV